MTVTNDRVGLKEGLRGSTEGLWESWEGLGRSWEALDLEEGERAFR